MANYQVRLYNESGTLQDVLTDFLGLSYYLGVNEPGQALLELSGVHSAVQALGDKWKIEIDRKDDAFGIDWYTVFSGLYREPLQKGFDPGIFYGTFLGDLHILDWRVVAWPAGTADRSKFEAEKAETILKTLVKYNITSLASTGNGRLRAGDTATGEPQITVQTDGSNGNTLDWYCQGKRLLGELQKIAEIAGGDFDLVKTAANTYDFRWYTGQLGTDRSSSVTFSVGNGNMANPAYMIRRATEKTVAIVGGQGEGIDRDFVEVQGANYSASNNNIEVWVDARDIERGQLDALESRGDQALVGLEAEEVFEFDVLQVPSTLWGVHYFLGDKVGAVSPFSGNTLTRKVNSISVSFRGQQGQEKIAVGLGNV